MWQICTLLQQNSRSSHCFHMWFHDSDLVRGHASISWTQEQIVRTVMPNLQRYEQKHHYRVNSNQNIHSLFLPCAVFTLGHIYLTYLFITNTYLTFLYDTALNLLLSKVFESDSVSDYLTHSLNHESFLLMFDYYQKIYIKYWMMVYFMLVLLNKYLYQLNSHLAYNCAILWALKLNLYYHYWAEWQEANFGLSMQNCTNLNDHQCHLR